MFMILLSNYCHSSRWSLNNLVNQCNRILAPTAYIFFASALPVIAFGEQLNRDTGTPLVFFFFDVLINDLSCKNVIPNN